MVLEVTDRVIYLIRDNLAVLHGDGELVGPLVRILMELIVQLRADIDLDLGHQLFDLRIVDVLDGKYPVA